MTPTARSQILTQCRVSRAAREPLRYRKRAAGRTPRSGRQRDFGCLNLARAAVVPNRVGEIELGTCYLRGRQRRPLDRGYLPRCMPKSLPGRSERADAELYWDLLRGGGAALEKLAAFTFHFRRAPGAGGAAVQALADVAAQLLQFQRAQLVLGFHQAQCLAHDFAGGVIASGGDFLAD